MKLYRFLNEINARHSFQNRGMNSCLFTCGQNCLIPDELMLMCFEDLFTGRETEILQINLLSYEGIKRKVNEGLLDEAVLDCFRVVNLDMLCLRNYDLLDGISKTLDIPYGESKFINSEIVHKRHYFTGLHDFLQRILLDDIGLSFQVDDDKTYYAMEYMVNNTELCQYQILDCFRKDIPLPPLIWVRNHFLPTLQEYRVLKDVRGDDE